MKKTSTEHVSRAFVASRQYTALLESFKLVREHMEIQAAIILNDTFNNNKKD